MGTLGTTDTSFIAYASSLVHSLLRQRQGYLRTLVAVQVCLRARIMVDFQGTASDSLAWCALIG